MEQRPPGQWRDGRLSCGGAALLERADHVAAWLDACDGWQGAPLGFECPTSLPGAVTLLALLRRRISFVLLPPESPRPGGPLAPLPSFCKARLRIHPVKGESDPSWRPGEPGYLELSPNPQAAPAVDPSLAEEGLLFLRTSGSMGAAKLVVHTHEGVLHNAAGCAAHYGLSERDRVLLPVPLAHMYGFGAAFTSAMLAGAELDLLAHPQVISYLSRERERRPTVAWVTPNLCDQLKKGMTQARSHYRLVITSGQRMARGAFREIDALLGGCLVNQYGSSELGAIAASLPVDALATREAGLGRPMPGVTLRLGAPDAEGADPSDGGPAPLWCRHPHGFVGYVDDDGRWLLRRAADQWHPTGDLAQAQVGGGLEILGRADAAFNRHGYLVLCRDVEERLEAIDGVSAAVVLPVEGPGLGEPQVLAFCAGAGLDSTAAERLGRECRERLPRYALPDRFVVMPALPLLPGGKVDRQALLRLGGAAPLPAAPTSAAAAAGVHGA